MLRPTFGLYSRGTQLQRTWARRNHVVITPEPAPVRGDCVSVPVTFSCILLRIYLRHNFLKESLEILFAIAGERKKAHTLLKKDHSVALRPRSHAGYAKSIFALCLHMYLYVFISSNVYGEPVES